MSRDKDSAFGDRHRGFTPEAILKAGLTTHAKERLRQRCSLEPGDLKQILNSNKCVFLEFEGTQLVSHKLFYSKSDDAHFVAIQNVSSGAVITIIPAKWWSNGPPISWRTLERAKELAQPRNKTSTLKPTSMRQVRKLRKSHRSPTTIQRPTQHTPANDYKFYVTLVNQLGESRSAYLARFAAWDVTDPGANRQAEKLLRAQMRQVSEEGETPIAIQMQLGSSLVPIDELLSRLL